VRDISLSKEKVQALVQCGFPDAALLYIYLKAGGDKCLAFNALSYSPARMQAAVQCLKDRGLWDDVAEIPPIESPGKQILASKSVQGKAPLSQEGAANCAVNSPGENVSATEVEVYVSETPTANKQRSIAEITTEIYELFIAEVEERQEAPITDNAKRSLLQQLAKTALPPEVLTIILKVADAKKAILMSCISIDEITSMLREWGEKKIYTEDAAKKALDWTKNIYCQVGKVCEIIGYRYESIPLRDRKYLRAWVDKKVNLEVIECAKERTLANKGSLGISYMNSIINSWIKDGLTTVAMINQQDPKKKRAGSSRRNGGFSQHGDPPTELERIAIQQALEDAGDLGPALRSIGGANGI